MIKITKINVQPYQIAGTTQPQTEEYSINYDDGRIIKGRLWYEKKSDSLMVAFRDENNNNRSPRKAAIDNEINLNGYYEVKPQGERTQSTKAKTTTTQKEIVTENDIKKYLSEKEVKEYQSLLEQQEKIYNKIKDFNDKIREGKEMDNLREILKAAIGKTDLDKVKEIIANM